MKTIQYFLIYPLLYVLLLSCSTTIDLKDQNIEVYYSAGNYHVIGAIDSKELFTSTSASEAINWAVSSSAERGTIFLHKGKYLLNKTITIENSITLQGSGTSTVLIVSKDHDTGNAILIENANKASVKELAIQSVKNEPTAKSGVVLKNSGDCLVSNIHVIGMQEDGVRIEDNSFLCEVVGSRFAACEGAAVRILNCVGGSRGGDFVPNNVNNCIIYQGGYGVVCDNAIVANISDVTVYQSKKNAFYITDQSNSVLITGCRTYQIQDDACVINNSHEINVSSNIFCWSEGHGIVLDGVAWGTISANNVIDNGSINPFERDVDTLKTYGPREFRRMPRTPKDRESIKSGIVVRNNTRGVTVSANAIFNWPAAPKMVYGILEDNTCKVNNFVGNNVNTYIKGDVLSQGKGSTVSGNVGYGEQPHAGAVGIYKLQYFDLRLIENFIDETWVD